MDTPLYKLYLFKRAPQYFATPPERMAEIRAKMDQRMRDLGIHDLFNAQMAWSNERYEYFGVEYYPNLAAVQEYARCMMELGYFQFVESESFLGLPMDGTYPNFNLEPPNGGETPIYRLYFSRLSELAEQTPRAELEVIYGRNTDFQNMAGIKPLLNAYVTWNNEEWEYFGIERFPNLDTMIRYSQFMTDTGWYRYINARSYLGSAHSGLVAGMGENL